MSASTAGGTGRVRVSRGDVPESEHRFHAVVLMPDGSEAAWGDAELVTFWRSAMKPFQTLPLVADGVTGAFGFGPVELALCCASHGGMPTHTGGVADMLARLGLPEDMLSCRPHAPFDRSTAEALLRAGRDPGRLHNNCSGKHAGMLALALHHGWEPEGYELRPHPVQRRIRAELSRWIESDPELLPWAVDGCGVPTPALPLRAMARAYRALAAAAAAGETGPASVVSAMRSHPHLTSSPGRPPLELMEATGARIVAKEGAEGVLCAVAPDHAWALAVKVEDGSLRAVGPAVCGVLERLGLLRGGERERLGGLGWPEVRNTLGAVVGTVRPEAGEPSRTRPAGTEA